MKRHILRCFPGVIALDLKRFPTIPHLKSLMVKVGFRNLHYHVVKHDEGFLPREECFDRVRKKYVSTLTLLNEEEFEKGIKIFEEKVKQKYGEQIRRITGFDFVIGKK